MLLIFYVCTELDVKNAIYIIATFNGVIIRGSRGIPKEPIETKKTINKKG